MDTTAVIVLSGFAAALLALAGLIGFAWGFHVGSKQHRLYISQDSLNQFAKERR